MQAAPPPAGSDPGIGADGFPHTALTCLVALMTHHGHDATVIRLVHDHALPAAEVAPDLLVHLAGSEGFKARHLRLDWSGLTGLGSALPALAYLKNGNVVLLVSVSEGEAVILDPLASAALPLTLPRPLFEAQWSGTVVLARPAARAGNRRHFGLGWFLPELWREKRSFRDVAVAAVLLHILGLATPLFFQLVIDRVLVHRAVSTLTVLTGGIVAVLIFEALFRGLRQYLLIFATRKIDIRIMQQTFAHLLRLPMALFERSSTGVLVKHMQQSEQIREFLTGRMFGAALDLTALVVYLPLLVFYSLKLSAVVLGFSLAIALLIFAVVGPLRRRLDRLYTAEGERQAMLVETIQGMRTVKTLALEPRQRREWERRAASAVNASWQVNSLSLGAQTITELCEKLMGIAVIAIGAFDVFAGSLSVGALVAFQMLSGRVTGPLVQVVALIHQYQETALSVRMLATIMNEPPERDGRGGMTPKLAGAVSFDQVSFFYPGTALPALDHLSFDLPAGSILGIVGRSGSGKTTMTRLLQGLFPPQSGLIKLDGLDIREIDLGHLRRSMGVVLQESFLFRGTIRSNIAATRSDASLEEIVQAARLAGAHEFIERLPMGYDTPLDENGGNLSGGQKQRLAIARALLPDPRLIILDEATSALDPESEAIVQDNLRQIAAGRTVIIVSHRLSSLTQADAILVLDRGRQVGLGRHADLLADCPPYRALWQQQTRYLQ